VHKEIEAKFLNIDKQAIIERLKELGAVKVFDEFLQRRCVYNLCKGSPEDWIRLRQEHNKVTLTYKSVNKAKGIHGVKEIEVIVDDFDKAREFLKAIGLQERAYQENLRVRYYLEKDDVTFDIDTWPGLPPYIEIEGPSEEVVKKYAKLLGFKWEDAVFGSTDLIYAQVYNVTPDFIRYKCPVLSFDNIPWELTRANLRR